MIEKSTDGRPERTPDTGTDAKLATIRVVGDEVSVDLDAEARPSRELCDTVVPITPAAKGLHLHHGVVSHPPW